MNRQEALEGRFEKHVRSQPICCAAEIGDEGLVLGAQTVLARMMRDAFGSPILALDEDGERLLALLGVASWRPASSDVLRHVEDASACWRRGEKALANIRLAHAGIPRIEDRAGAYRLFLAEALLDDGMSPRELTKALGLEAPALEKFDPSQPRVPAGSGRTSGRWTRGGTGAPAPAESPAPSAAATPKDHAPLFGFVAAGGARTLAQALFGEASGSTLLAGLAVLGETVGAGIVLGAIFVPSPNRSVTEGAIPGLPGLFYHLDAPAGALRLFRNGTAGREVVVSARQERDGIFVDPATGAPIARILGGSLVFDADQLADATGESRLKTRSDEPNLCPKIEPDTPHGAKEPALAYEDQIKLLINPLQPTPRGWGVNLFDPMTGQDVFFDDCRRSDGAMIEVKGPGFDEKLRKSFFQRQEIFPREWTDRALRQVQAADWRDVEWYFAEPEAAEVALRTFKNDKRLKKIRVFHVPAQSP
jgi:hypothetical protein